ncbi:MAG: thioesterase domain-containing protein [Verrucomicrobiota bacterium]|nr:thioesterase domain-containing protein [Verrucomicrobiota bacterium]MDQ6938653.1 thioesterase domain-containing protein [Verrucomicrobiota bacterium]
MKESDLRAMEEFLHRRIPLTCAMGVRVTPDTAHRFAVEAPVSLNYNHLRTAFGGSINAVATLAGYGFLWLELRETAHVVIADSSIRFLRPINEMIRAVCLPPADSDWREFHATFHEKGKARLSLKVSVEEKGIRAAEFEGLFFAIAN